MHTVIIIMHTSTPHTHTRTHAHTHSLVPGSPPPYARTEIIVKGGELGTRLQHTHTLMYTYTYTHVHNVIHMHMCTLTHKIDAAEDQKTLRDAMLHIDYAIEAGCSTPACLLTMEDKAEFVHAICLHHAIPKSKAELDQMMRGLDTHGVCSLMKKYPSPLEGFFVYREEDELTAGIYLQLSPLIIKGQSIIT